MKKTHQSILNFVSLIVLIFMLVSCSGAPTPTTSTVMKTPTGQEVMPTVTKVEVVQPTNEPQPSSLPPQATNTPQPTPFVPHPGSPLVVEKGKFFSTAGACTSCHTQMIDSAGNNVSMDTAWQASILANSSIDPYWKATVRSEISQLPDLRQVIEGKCAKCHNPMAATTDQADEATGAILDLGYLDETHLLHKLAIDGVSCTVCHQLESDNFGNSESFSGGFLVNLSIPSGERMAYGPFAVNQRFSILMQNVSGFIPQQTQHISAAELCSSCHDLYTPFVDDNDQVAGIFPEQTIYTEWLNSKYSQEQTCQSCHMPLAQGSVQLSITGGPNRSPIFQHTFNGANVYMLKILQQHGSELNSYASSDMFTQSIVNSETQLNTNTASVSIDPYTIESGILKTEVVIQTKVGHKFPAGYPSRRSWLHIQLVDSTGAVIFESGSYSTNGSIDANDNDTDPTRYEPHYTVIRSPDQVQIYESIMANINGKVTTTLMRGANYVKDNRLLPLGYDQNKVPVEIAVYGSASSDPDFLAGGDRLALQIPLGDFPPPYELKIDLLYQSIGYRWATNLMLEKSTEVDVFSHLYNTIPNIPVLVATAQLTIEK